MTHILMVAAENAALPGGKVGGIGDVVRDIPLALAQRDCQVSVVTPGYGSFSQLAGAKLLTTFKVRFAGVAETVQLYELVGYSKHAGVKHYALEHPLFSAGGVGRIYCDDPPGQPFKSDASKFALFCLAVAEAVVRSDFGDIDVLHLHDWHAAFLLVLKRYDPTFLQLQALRCVYSIHNLAIQGIRPFAGDESALETWYPWLVYDRQQLVDPQWSDCINPMASAIRLADAVHTVSPSYAEEILLPAEPERGISGGEGLDADLRQASQQGRLHGILNGCDYPEQGKTPAPDWPEFLRQARRQVEIWASASQVLASAHFIADKSLDKLGDQRPPMLLTSIGRVTDQKVGLMREPTSAGQPALWAALDLLGEQALLLMIGSGDPVYEQFLCETAAKYDNFVFLRGYSESLADPLYQMGDLFFMPSSFEPCGISQMLAMRAGQPCLVHHVGGLRDTVKDNSTGFAFTGNNPTEQADGLVATLQRALEQYQKKGRKWSSLRKAAAAARFEWADSIDAYLKLLYQRP